MEKLRENIILAGLLHDIGKFWQRADPNASVEKSKFLESTTRSIIGDFCPKKGNRCSHLHSAWTYQFLATFEKYCYNNGLNDEKSLISIAAKHHNPTTITQEIIQKADWISAGMDRSKCEDVNEEISEESKRRFNYRKQRLRPVFESVYANDYKESKKSEVLRYGLTPLELNQNHIFPFESDGEDRSLDVEFREKLWKPFEKELSLLPKSDFHPFLESMLALLWKYTWCIPSSTIDIPDISLYDHLRSTAAVALCMYDYLNENVPDALTKNRLDSPYVRQLFENEANNFATLICGDISGIQPFIYQIASKKAAVSLKGRSYMIQLISDTCARYMLQQLNLPITNLVYSSGGNFYILAPTKAKIQQKIDQIKSTVNTGLLNKYHGALYLAVGSTTLSAQDFMKRLNEKWEDAIQAAKHDKNQRFIREMKNKVFFEPFGPVANVHPCTICGKDMETSQEEPVCEDCQELIELGKQLKNAHYLIEYHNDNGQVMPIPGISITYTIASTATLKSRLIPSESFIKIWRLNETNFLPEAAITLNDYAYGFRFLGGNYMYFNEDGTPKTFNDLVGEKEENLKRMGVLRIDVDNLGRLLKYGFISSSIKQEKSESKEYYSLSRLSTLSSMLDIFFSGYLNTIAQQPKYEDCLLIIYSGGDDIFLVGKWDNAVACAMEIRECFRDYCCTHPDFTLSGGMAITALKYPIHRAADLAGEYEERAKSYSFKIHEGLTLEKDAFTFLDKTLDWHDFQIVESMKNDIFSILDSDKEGMNHGFLNRMRRIHENYRAEKRIIEREKSLSPEKRTELVQYGKWRWRMVYDLARFIKQNEEYTELVNNIQKAILNGHHYKEAISHQNIQEFIDVPTRWVELLLKDKIKKKGDIL